VKVRVRRRHGVSSRLVCEFRAPDGGIALDWWRCLDCGAEYPAPDGGPPTHTGRAITECPRCSQPSRASSIDEQIDDAILRAIAEAHGLNL